MNANDIELYQSIREAWGVFRESTAKSDVVAMRNGLEEFFKMVSQPSISAQLLLVDEHRRIVFAISSSSEEWSEQLKQFWEQLSLDLSGVMLPEDSFYWEVLQSRSCDTSEYRFLVY